MILLDIVRMFTPETFFCYHDRIGQTSLTEPYEMPKRLFARVLSVWVDNDTVHVLLDYNFNAD